jgi:hypothetical protein
MKEDKLLMYGLVAIGIIMVWKLSNYKKTYSTSSSSFVGDANEFSDNDVLFYE